jgi:hypothetical protein
MTCRINVWPTSVAQQALSSAPRPQPACPPTYRRPARREPDRRSHHLHATNDHTGVTAMTTCAPQGRERAIARGARGPGLTLSVPDILRARPACT